MRKFVSSERYLTFCFDFSKDSVDSGNDKGMRWKFLSGLGVNGYIATQAHESHIVGYDASDNEFHADFKSSNDDSAVVAQFLNGSQRVTLCYNDNCIGAGGKSKCCHFGCEINEGCSQKHRDHGEVRLGYRSTSGGLTESHGRVHT